MSRDEAETLVRALAYPAASVQGRAMGCCCTAADCTGRCGWELLAGPSLALCRLLHRTSARLCRRGIGRCSYATRFTQRRASDVSATPQGRLKWRFDTDFPLFSSPAVVDGRLYLGSGDGRIVALDADNGELIWEHEVLGPVDSSPAVAGDSVFIGFAEWAGAVAKQG